MKKSLLTTIASFTYIHEAHIAQASLSAEGIFSLIPDEHTISMQWLYSNALGGVRLQVPSELAEKAQQIINQDLSHLVEAEFSIEKVKCSRCGSVDLKPFTSGKKPAFLVFLLLGFPLFFNKHGIKCESCGEFKKV